MYWPEPKKYWPSSIAKHNFKYSKSISHVGFTTIYKEFFWETFDAPTTIIFDKPFFSQFRRYSFEAQKSSIYFSFSWEPDKRPNWHPTSFFIMWAQKKFLIIDKREQKSVHCRKKLLDVKSRIILALFWYQLDRNGN